jgi:hypothetical protein
MNGFLVLLRHTMDDFPVYLCETHEEALKAAKEQDWFCPEIQRLFVLDATTPVEILVVKFENGIPVAGDTVRTYEAEIESSTH